MGRHRLRRGRPPPAPDDHNLRAGHHHTTHHHERQEHAINVYINVNHAGDSLHVVELPAGGHRFRSIDLDDTATDDTILDVLRAIAKRCPRQYRIVAAGLDYAAAEERAIARAERARRVAAPDHRP